MIRSIKSLLPFILASIGFVMLIQVESMTLLEWQITETVVGSQSTYRAHFSPEYWDALFGQPFDVNAPYFRRPPLLGDQQPPCSSETLKIVAKRSQNDETIDRVLLSIYNRISWLFDWAWIGIILSVIYMWWFVLWYQPGNIRKLVVSTVIVVFFCILVGPVLRLVGPRLAWSPIFDLAGPPDCYGTVTLDAVLVNVHYKVPIYLLAGICLELGAFGMMFQQIRRATMERKEVSKSSVG